MGDDKYRSGIIDQICFQPGNGIQIQVVCRLIKQEDIRTLLDETGEPKNLAVIFGENHGSSDLLKVYLSVY